MPSTLLFVRHGQNPANLSRQLSCRTVDLSLNERGRAQARAVAAHLASGAEGRIDALFSSPLRRAGETAEVIGLALGLETTVLEGLRELDVGDLEGRSDEEAWRLHDAVDAEWLEGREGAFPGGEDLPTFLARFRAAVATIAEAVPDGRAVVVGHGGFLRIGMANVFRLPGAAPMTDAIGNCSILELELTGSGSDLSGRVVGWARVDHLLALDPA